MVLDKVYTETYMNSDKYAGSTILAHLDALDAKEKYLRKKFEEAWVKFD